MPRFRDYAAETTAQGLPPVRNAVAADFGGDGLQAFGGAIHDAGAVLEHKAAQDDVTNVRVALAKARAEWDVHFRERATAAAPGDPTFAEKFGRDFQDYIGKARDVAQTPAGQRVFDVLSADMAGRFTEKAVTFQAQSAGVRAKQNWEVSMNAYGTSLITDPTQYGSVLAQALGEINDPQGQYARVDPATRALLVAKAKDQLAQAYVHGLVDNGAPELARRLLMEGKLDDQLSDDAKHRLVKEADVGIRAKDTAADRARLEAKRAQEDAQRAVTDKFLARIVQPTRENGGPLSDREILADTTLDTTQKQHFIDYKMRRARELAANAEVKTNPAEVRRLMLEIHAPEGDPTKTYNTDNVMAAYRAGKISTAEMRLLRGEVEQLRDGNTQGFQRDVQSARNAVYTALTRSTLGQVRPEVAADAAYRWSRDLEVAVERKRKANEDPRALLTPGHKEYMLDPKVISSYMQQPREAVADEAKRIRNEPGARSVSGKIDGPPVKALPTYLDYESLKPGDEYTDPAGNVRSKK